MLLLAKLNDGSGWEADYLSILKSDIVVCFEGALLTVSIVDYAAMVTVSPRIICAVREVFCVRACASVYER